MSRDDWPPGRRQSSHWSLPIYAALLRLYPPTLRREYGDDMLQAFRDTLREETRCRGRRGARRAWAIALGDLAASMPGEWSRELRRGLPVSRARRYGLLRRTRLPGGGWRIEGWLGSAPARRPLLLIPGRPARMVANRARRMTMQDRFDRFTEQARHVLQLAQEEAQSFNHNYIGTEHLLLGLLREEEGLGARALVSLGVELEKARHAVELIIGRGDRVILGDIGLTPRAKKVVELAVDEARRLGQRYVGTEHLLLGLVREGEGIAAGVLESLGVSLETARAEVQRMMAMSGSAPTMPATSAARDPLRLAVLYLALACRDINATAMFYVEALGASVATPNDSASQGLAGGERLLRLPFGGARGGGTLLALRAATPDEAAVTGPATGAIELRVIASDIAGLHSAIKERGAAGLTNLAEIPGAPNMRAFTLTDPDGRVLRFQGIYRA
ncbi:MAG TPA: Clp protease N-terminal domain-containing protein [Ktedonobacterales bacterium]